MRSSMLVHWLKTITFSWVTAEVVEGAGRREDPPSTLARRMSDLLRPPSGLPLAPPTPLAAGGFLQTTCQVV